MSYQVFERSTTHSMLISLHRFGDECRRVCRRICRRVYCRKHGPIAVSLLALTLFILPACTKKTETEPTAVQSLETEAAKLAARGRSVYMAQCIACHNANPSRDGGLGPAVANSSFELLEARILHATYPVGYTPKRASKTMPAMPHLKNELAALHAYLNSQDK